MRQDSVAVKLDQFGENVLRDELGDARFIRPVQIEAEYVPAAGTRARVTEDGLESPAVRVTEVEYVLPADIALIRQSGLRKNAIATGEVPETTPTPIYLMTDAQAEAYVRGLDELNAKGYVWLDNKPDNFGFKPIGEGSRAQQLVIIDAGGIIPINPQVAAALDRDVSDLARELQRKVNGKFETEFPNSYHKVGTQYRTQLRKSVIRDEYGHYIDLERMGLTDQREIWFNPIAGERLDYLAPRFEARD